MNNHWYFCEAKNEAPCIVCGRPTSKVDIHYEQRVCSVECVHVLDMELMEQESEGKVI